MVLSKIFPNHIELHPPHADAALKGWKAMLERDAAAVRQSSNRSALGKALAK
jgi:hypothetical protein